MLFLPAQTTHPSRLEGLFESLRMGDTFTGTTWAGWIALLACIFGGVLCGKVVSTLLRSVSDRLKQRKWELRATVFTSASGPSYLLFITIGLSIGLGGIVLSDALQHKALTVLKFLYSFSLGWFLYNLVDLIEVALLRITSKTESKLDDQLVPLVRKTLRIFVVVVFALFIAGNVFGADISAWLAGLGIAGLAVSLAAQDSIKNLFGSITIFLDRPFMVGDNIVFSGIEGTVEEIGFRSTKLRTPTGSLVTLPNSTIVNDKVENMSNRPHIRRKLDVTLAFDTPPAKVEEAIRIIRSIFEDPEIAPAFADMEKFPPRVGFDNFNADSLNIVVIYWFYPTDQWKYVAHAEKFNLKLLLAFEQAGIEIAFPTRTLYLADDPKRRFTVRTESNPAN